MEPPAAAACASCRRRPLPPLLCLLLAALCLPPGEPARGERGPRPRRPVTLRRRGRAQVAVPARRSPAPTAGSLLAGGRSRPAVPAASRCASGGERSPPALRGCAG